MSRGGFDRRVKVEGKKVVDHRPTDYKDDSFVLVHVPEDLPATLNELITIEALHIEGGKLAWDEDWQERKIETEGVDELSELKRRIEKLENAIKTITRV